MPDKSDDIFNIKQTSKIEFKEMCGFTFVFKTNTYTFKGNVASMEMKPIAIIYEENDDYYLAPLDKVDNINMIVEEFVKNHLLG